MANQNFSTSVEQQAPRGKRAQKGDAAAHLPELLETIVALAYALNEQTSVALSGNTTDQDGLLRGVQQLARQVGFLASIGQQQLGGIGVETNPIEWLCRNP